jgi:hypothetical protein
MRAAALLPLLVPAALAAAPPAAKRGISLVAVAISPSTISVTCQAARQHTHKQWGKQLQSQNKTVAGAAD